MGGAIRNFLVAAGTVAANAWNWIKEKVSQGVQLASRVFERVVQFFQRAPQVANRLPGTTAESVVDKLQRYLLNPDHPAGGPKAKWFEQALGFTRENLGALARQIVFDPAKAVQTGVTEHGTKFNQVIEICGANGKRIEVVFAWIRNNDGVVRLVTAIPADK